MAIDLEAIIAHDPKDIRDALERMQGNILKGHGREHTVHVFVKFIGEDVGKLRADLTTVTGTYVTSAWKQLEERRIYKGYRIPGGVFGNFFLTKKGYGKLGFSDGQIGNAFQDPFFRQGMTTTIDDLNDPASSQWEEGYDHGDIDAMFLLADDDRDFLLRRSRDLLNAIEDFCEVRAIERGDTLRDPVTNEGIEHFGYVDGRSQPIYLDIDLPAEGTTNKWNPIEPLKIVLVQDPMVDADAAGPENFGSYFVFRKLEQNVRDFNAAEERLADALGFATPEERARAGAMAVGRFKDGTPLVLSQTDGFVPLKENDFTYEQDDDPGGPPNGGLKCPYHAHIRKANPRGDVTRHFGADEREGERDRRITRRGIPFGQRPTHPNAFQTISELPSAGVGLLFMCFQSSIVDQFAFMQSAWVNNEGFVNGGTGIDPIIGQFASGTTPLDQNWPKKWGPPADPDPPNTPAFRFEGFVKMKGGEFFFAPSMEFLKTFAPPA